MSLWNISAVSNLPKETEIAWLHQDRIPMGAVSMLGGMGGVGKSVYVAALEIAVASGKPFLDAEVTRGTVLHFDFDTDARLQGPWYQRVATGMHAPEAALSQVHYIAPTEEGTPYLTLDRLKTLPDLVEEHKPALIVIDAWTSAFPYIRSNDAGEVAQVMAALRAIAKNGPAVLILDHTPKPTANAPSAVERGLIGSTLKMAGARAVHLLSRVAPKEVDGRDVQRLDTLKNNLAPIGEPLGIERIWGGDGAVSFSVTDLPEIEARAPALERAMRYLRDNLENEMPRKDLLRGVIRYANVSERTAASALARLVAAGEFEAVAVDGRAKAYRPVASLHTSEKDRDGAEKSVQTGLQSFETSAQVPEDGPRDTPVSSLLYERLRRSLEQGGWRIENAGLLLDYYHRAEQGDDSARASIQAYLQRPQVAQALGGNS